VRAPPRSRLRLATLVLGAALALGLLVWSTAERDLAEAPAAAVARAAASGPAFAGAAADGGLAPPAQRAERRRRLLENVQLTDHTYCSYRSSSQYPPGSRPMTENADQNRPNDPVDAINAMRLEGGGADAKVQLQTSQSRVWLAAGETVAFSLRALDAQGNVLPLVVTRAVAQGLVVSAGRPGGQVAVPFTDDGNGADRTAGDGTYSGVLAPGQTGLAGFDGTIRTEVRYSVGGAAGLVQFDVIHTPVLPASWTGQVRQALEDGSLNFYLRLDVRQPGRYVVSGRVDDARGQPVALLTFNQLLGPGPQEVRLAMFGKLLRDSQPVQPLALRDVDGYLLKESGDPDRALLPRLQGQVAAGARHDAAAFSDAEWQSEERSRYLAEFARDQGRARAALASFDPAAPLPPSECAPPPGASVK
jgi:hypothetical protein